MRKMGRILALVIVMGMCIGMVLGLTSCKKDDDTTGGNTYNVTVWVAENAVELTKQQIANFNSTNTDGITINATVSAVGEGEAATNMITDVEAGADIFCFAQDQFVRLVNAGALAKLGSGAAATVAADNDATSVAAVKSGDGSYYAYPLTADNGYFLYYDKRVISDDIVGSLEDIIAACKTSGKNFSMKLESSAWYAASFFFGTGCVSEWTLTEDGSDFASYY
ncbi:MAG: extracellular solute-binding protein, partial [Eubacteriales bacterium]